MAFHHTPNPSAASTIVQTLAESARARHSETSLFPRTTGEPLHEGGLAGQGAGTHIYSESPSREPLGERKGEGEGEGEGTCSRSSSDPSSQLSWREARSVSLGAKERGPALVNVLIVGNDAQGRDRLLEVCNREQGFSACACETGEEALDKISSASVDAVFVLPGRENCSASESPASITSTIMAGAKSGCVMPPTFYVAR